MKYVFTPFAAESKLLSRKECVKIQLGYEDYLSDNGYSYTPAMFVHDAYYKWGYFTINDMPDRPDKLPYVPGDEIYFVLGHDLDKFKETVLKEDDNNFKFVEKSDFYDWALYNGCPKLKEIANNYFKNTRCSYTQFKNLNVGDVFKITNREFLYIKVFPIDFDNWDAIVLTGDRKGYPIMVNLETCVERCDSSLKELASKYLKDDKDNFMTYGGVDYNKIANNTFNYNSADVKNTLQFLELRQDYKRISFPCIKKVIFNKPATIVIWADNTKTVVKAQKGEKYDKEKGLALCYMKKILGNQGNFNDVFREWVKPEVTAVYDKKHPELGIQDIPPKNSAKLPSNQARIKSSELKIIHKYMRDNVLTYTYIAKNSGLSINTVKRALTGCPVLKTTLLKVCGYFEFPIGFTYYEED